LIKSDKYDVKIVPLRWGSTPQDALDPSRPDDKIILDRLTDANLSAKPDIFVHVTIPNEFQRAGKFNIGVTAGIETTVCRPDWIDGCNRMDLVLASSQHSKRVFEQSKFEKRDQNTQQVIDIIQLKRPVEVLFEGVDTKVYNKAMNSESGIVKQLDGIPEDFCFLFVGHWLQGGLGHDRKDVGMLIRVFLESFKHKIKSKMPALVLKTSLAGFSVVERDALLQRISDIRSMVKGKDWNKDLPNIYVLHGALTDEEMNDMYNHPKIKAIVSFTKGEGFGRPLLEFTTTGKPVLASGWSGPLDFLNPEYSIILRGSLNKVHESAVNDWILRDSNWFTVDYDFASHRMLEVNKLYDKVLATSKKHRRYTIENFSLDAMAEKLIDYIDNVSEYASRVIKPTDQIAMQPMNLPKLKRVGEDAPDAPAFKSIQLPKRADV
jgi:glycosyltransferase involved in cell wall biosynthesis